MGYSSTLEGVIMILYKGNYTALPLGQWEIILPGGHIILPEGCIVLLKGSHRPKVENNVFFRQYNFHCPSGRGAVIPHFLPSFQALTTARSNANAECVVCVRAAAAAAVYKSTKAVHKDVV